jgi:hypothetical protein
MSVELEAPGMRDLLGFLLFFAVSSVALGTGLDEAICQFDVIERVTPAEGAIVPVGDRGQVVYSCAGAVIGRRHFLTNAHCTDELKKARNGISRIGRIFCGNGRDVHFVGPRDVLTNKDWRTAQRNRARLDMVRFDMALIAPKEDFAVSSLILPSNPEELKASYEGSRCELFSFGGRRADRGERVRRFPLPIMNAETRSLLASQQKILDDRNIIYADFGDFLVRGDSGGALVCSNTDGDPRLVGLVGAGKTLRLSNGEAFVNMATSVHPLVVRTQAISHMRNQQNAVR